MSNSVVSMLIQLSFPGILGFIFLTAFIIADKTFPENTLRLTLRALISNMFLLVADALNYYLESIHDNSTFRLFILAVSFSSKIATSGFCIAISQRDYKKGRKVLYSLIVLNMIISYLSIPTGCVFHIENDFSVGHGKLYFIPYIVILINCTILLISGIRQYRTNKGETVIILAMIFFPFVATYLEVKHHFVLMLPLAFQTCIIFYFMCLNVQLYRRDTLTNLLNRRSLFMDAKRHSKKKIHILSMDLNNLKYYNDTFGHAAGDKAILTATKNMNLAFSYIGVVYRTGGDEFIALFMNKPQESVDDALLTFNLLMEKTEYRVACGLSLCTPEDDFESIMAESDAKMYRNKMAFKEKQIKEGDKRLMRKEIAEFESIE